MSRITCSSNDNVQVLTSSDPIKNQAQDVLIYPLAAFFDNYIWILRQAQNVIVVDPGDANPVIEELSNKKLVLKAIFITHHHADHTGGIQALVKRFKVPVYGPATEKILDLTNPLSEDDRIKIEGLDLIFSVIETPGHTLDHIVYYTKPQNQDPALFCGDTLFSCGSGKLFEGNSRNMWQSIDKFRKLPQNTRIFCAHEYTLSNISWALQVEPGNKALQLWSQRARKLREAGMPTIPTSLAQEWEMNPFLRVTEGAVVLKASARAGRVLNTPDEVFAVLREWKNSF